MGNEYLLQEGVSKSDISINELGLSENFIRDLNSSLIKTLSELLNLDINSQKFRFVACESMRKKLIDLIHSLGLKFSCELENYDERNIQDDLLDNIRLVGLSNYMKQQGIMYQITMIDELALDDHYIGVIRYCTEARTIDELLKLDKNQLSRLFYNKTDLFIQQVHDLGYMFDFELQNYDDIASLYKKKETRLMEIYQEINALQLERQRLEKEIYQLIGREDLGKIYSKRK